MSTAQEAARIALRQRQGPGARYDAPAAPARSLDWARRGTAYFARLLNNLSDADLDAPSALPGLSRRHIIAHIGYQARTLSEIVAWTRTGQNDPFPRAAEVASGDVALGVTLPPSALRYLFNHSEVHLNVEWRDLADADWEACVEDATGRRIALRETPETRARAIWLHAMDLNAGGRFTDMSPAFIDALIRHYAKAYSGKVDLVLSPSDRQQQVVIDKASDITVTGRAADIARWLCGRGARRLRVDGKLPEGFSPSPSLVGP